MEPVQTAPPGQSDIHDEGAESELPVGRKRRRDSERARATRACDRCKKRKVRCNGVHPCEVCARVSAPCTYEAVYTRGRAPTIPSASTSSGWLQEQTPGPNTTLDSSGLHDVPHDAVHDAASSFTGPLDVGISSQSSPEPFHDDSQGQYIGPTSGVSFLLRVQRRLHQAISIPHASTIFTFGDAPLNVPEFEPSFCMMLPRDDAQRLVNRYFDYAMPTYRFLHRPTLQSWFDEFYDTLGSMRDPNSAPAKVALVFMVLAHARVYMPNDDLPGPVDLSSRYYLAAEHQLSREKGAIRLTSIQARLMQCYYLLTQSRINQCWSLFGTVSHLLLAIGLNRHKRPDPSSLSSVVEVECRRRTFWAAYTLDVFLSVALGRPRSFHDQDIDTELPSCCDDDDLTEANFQGASGPSPGSQRAGISIMAGPLAHNKLARIIGRIISDLYSIKPISGYRRTALTERISQSLSDWRVKMGYFLDADPHAAPVAGTPSMLAPLFKRQRNVLNLTYWHAIILTYRPIVLEKFSHFLRQARTRSSMPLTEDPEAKESMQQCIGAAMDTVQTVEDMAQSRQLFRAFWITTYFAFTAIIMLYLCVIQKAASPPEVYSAWFSAASRCQAHLSAIAEKGSLSERYCLVLEELRGEALRQARRMHPPQASALAPPNVGGIQANDSNVDVVNSLLQESGLQTLAGVMPLEEESPSSMSQYAQLFAEPVLDLNGMAAYPQITDELGWVQFMSMVSAGMGNFDARMEDGLLDPGYE